jgi:hypothetical protein
MRTERQTEPVHKVFFAYMIRGHIVAKCVPTMEFSNADRETDRTGS